MRRLGQTDSARFNRRRGVLAHHTLAFAKVSSTNPAIGFATVVPARDSHVEGVLNTLTLSDISLLDEIELVPIHYIRRSVAVIDCATCLEGSAEVYFGCQKMHRPGLIPTRKYLTMLLEGADLLSPAYVDALARQPCHEAEFSMRGS